MRKIIIFFICIFCVLNFKAQNISLQELHFSNDGEFRIVVFADCSLSDEKSEQTGFVLRTIEIENPQLVVFEGCTGNTETLKELLRKRNVGYVFVAKDDGRDMVVPVMSSDGNGVYRLLYFFDSYSYLKEKGSLPGITFNQVSWYRQNSRMYADKNGGIPVAALAFMCLPLPEYCEAARVYGGKSSSKKGAMTFIGHQNTVVSSENVNSGLFTSMYECGDVRGIFCGHDADNDFALVWKNIMLAYSRCSSVARDDCGARVIVLKEGEDGFSTFVRLDTNEVTESCTFPSDFIMLK